MSDGTGTEQPGYEDDDETTPVVRTVGRLVKLWRGRTPLTQGQLGAAIGYSLDQVRSVEGGRRVPQPDFLTKADQVLGAQGILAAMQQDVAEARYPKKVRDLAKLEREAVELGAYANHNMHGLLQTEEYARALFAMRRPLLPEEAIEEQVAARMARQEIIGRGDTPLLNFVLEEVLLHRPLGGRSVQRRQLQRLLEAGELRHVEIQVMPTDREDHAGMGGELQVLKLRCGTSLGYLEVQRYRQLVSEPHEVQYLQAQHGIIRAQALSPRESLTLIENVLGET